MARDGVYRRVKQLASLLLTSDNRAKAYLLRGSLVSLVGVALLMTTLLAFRSGAPEANAQSLRISSAATCAQLARNDPTATNGSSWGQTILPGHGAPGGWFGVDVCSNGFNSVSPNGSNVSCESASRHCAATNDGFGWTFQCPELIVRFSTWAFGDNPADWGRSGWGNAPDLWLPVNHPTDFVMYPNGSSTAPVPGDILIWGDLDSNGNPWPAGPDGAHGGHIAVVAAVHGGMVFTAEQNVKWGSQDHPSDTLALTKAGTRWILSGSSQPAKTLPTWRWLRTMGHSRGTYGWLHSVKNDGHFPNTHATAGSAPTAKKTNPSNAISQQFPGGLPSLSAATVVTQSGTLADLTWSTQSFFTPSADPGQPQAQARSLGMPPGGVRLASGQTAATLLLNDGSRYTYALGVDGHLYMARTTPDAFGIFWSDLGQPSGVTLTGSPAASLFAGGAQIAALGSDGNLWWRAGPPNRPGNWLSLGKPSATTLSGSLALAGVPGSGAPMLFALGADGRLYSRFWQDATTAADGTQIPAAWSDWLALGVQPASSQLTGSLLVTPETPSAHNWIGSWSDSPLNVFATDSAGKLWWFRATQLANGWTATAIPGNAAPLTGLLGGVAVPAASSNSATNATGNVIEVYVAAHTASYMATLTIPGSGKGATNKPVWTTLPNPPAGMATSAAGIGVALGAGNSVLVAAAGDDIVIGGAQTMTTALLSATAGQVSGGKQPSNPWMRVGAMPASATFSDSFTATHLDSRWSRSDASVRARLDAHGLMLYPGAHGVAALLQSAPEGDMTLTAQFTRPDTLPGKGAAGLVLYQDDGDWLTLLVDHAGTVRLCPTAQQIAQPCMAAKAKANRSLWLRIQRSGSAFTAQFSADGVAWQAIGTWTPIAPSAVTTATSVTPTPHGFPVATPTTTATPNLDQTPGTNATTAPDPAAAPLAFTSWGVLVTGDGNAAGWPHIMGFTVTPASATAPASATPTVTP